MVPWPGPSSVLLSSSTGKRVKTVQQHTCSIEWRMGCTFWWLPTCGGDDRTAKEDFELHGKRIKEGTVILASLMYAKACDPRISRGDHVDSPLPRHMDISRPLDSFKPERWLDDANKLDSSVRLHSLPLLAGERIVRLCAEHPLAIPGDSIDVVPCLKSASPK